MSEANRRAHPRHPMQVAISVLDRNPEGPAAEVNGTTQNVSLGGVLAVLEAGLSVGADSNCLVKFQDTAGMIEPEFRWGVALRSEPVDGGFQVAIQFHTSLELLVPPA